MANRIEVPVTALSYSVRVPLVLKYIGQLFVVFAALTAVPLAVALLLGDLAVAVRYACVVAAVLGLGLWLSRLNVPEAIQTNEAMVITAATFLICSLLLIWPMMASGLSFQDAWFETVSGLTTTGLSTLTSVDAKPMSFLFARAWMQWTGGLGIVVLSLAALIEPGQVARRMGDVEAYDEDLIGSARANARRVLVIYTLLTMAAIVVLWPLLGDGFKALLYALAAVSTGGFAPEDGSLGALPAGGGQFAVIAFSLAGAVPLIAYYRTYYGGKRALFDDVQVRGLIVAAGLVTLSLSLLMWLQEDFSWHRALRHGALNALSAQSTAGFSSLEIPSRSAAEKGILILAMAMGGCVGSTAGGIKVMRLLILMRLLQMLLRKPAMPPHALMQPKLGAYRLENEETHQALLLILLFIGLITLSWIPFLVMGYDPLDSLFEVVSALGTVGLSAGITDPALHPLLKTILCIDMMLGRLEIIAWLVVFYPPTWVGARRKE